MARILGIDFGERRVGLAVSDPLKIIAQPYATLVRDAGDGWWSQLEAVISEQEIELAVVGYPLTMSGDRGSQTLVVDEFIADLEQKLASNGVIKKMMQAQADFSEMMSRINRAIYEKVEPALKPPDEDA